MDVLEVEEKRTENIWRNNDWKLPNFHGDHVYKSQSIQVRWALRFTQRHIIIKLSKAEDTEWILKAAREKQIVTYKGFSVRLLADLSSGP